jgi:hypothetical protein
MSKFKKTSAFPDWLRADDALAENPELRLMLERARREGYTQGFDTAIAAAADGADPYLLQKVSNLVWAWKENLSSEQAPNYGTAWSQPPTERDRGVQGILESLADDADDGGQQ